MKLTINVQQMKNLMGINLQVLKDWHDLGLMDFCGKFFNKNVYYDVFKFIDWANFHEIQLPDELFRFIDECVVDDIMCELEESRNEFILEDFSSYEDAMCYLNGVNSDEEGDFYYG